MFIGLRVLPFEWEGQCGFWPNNSCLKSILLLFGTEQNTFMGHFIVRTGQQASSVIYCPISWCPVLTPGTFDGFRSQNAAQNGFKTFPVVLR